VVAFTDAGAGTFNSSLTASSFVKTSGTSSQFLKADGSVDSSVYALDSAVVKLAGTQTITGNKAFTLAPTFDAGAGFKNPSGLYNYITATDTGWKMPVNFNKEHIFVLNTSTAYTYTFPSATGTLALTSDLGAYLPLAGGTLTGALNGTSALFSSAVRANNPSEGATGEGLIAGWNWY
jgi:3D (Asp-Asp-Asp) domain-containing protein